MKKDDDSERMPVLATSGLGVRVAEPEEGNLGVRERVIACTPWKVPARMSMSFALRCCKGEVCVDVDVGAVGALGELCGAMKLRW